MRKICFNPCCDGLYKRTLEELWQTTWEKYVSILVVMDYIKELIGKQYYLLIVLVSILVVMDYIKEQFEMMRKNWIGFSFNPCCDGLYKRTWLNDVNVINYSSFNPCCDGLYKRTMYLFLTLTYTLLFQSLLWWII